jgi:integrase
MPAAKGTRLVKHANGFFYIKGRGAGKGQSTRTRDREEAERALAAFIQDRDRHAGVAHPLGLTWGQAVDDYITEHARPNIAAWQQAEVSTATFLHWIGGDKLISETRESDMREYQAARRAGGLQGPRQPLPLKPAGDGTIIRDCGVLSAVLGHAVRNGRIPKSALPNIPVPRQPPPRQRWMTAEEEQRMLDACGPQDGRLSRIYRFLMLCMHTAARRQAIESLTWRQVDMRARTIDMNPVGRSQTKKRRPVITMSNALYEMLKRAWHERTGTGLYVLDHPGSIRTSFETVREAAGLEDVSPHIYRHTWATRAARAGVPMREVADFLGDDLRTVEKVYYKHSPEYLKAARDWREIEKEKERNYG